jgi:hypothetical protein
MLAAMQTLAAFATVVGIPIGLFQLYIHACQSVSTFEDQLTHEYRQIAAKIPIMAFLGQDFAPEKCNDVREQIYNYFDLSNEQVFLRQMGRISRRTWSYWKDGIKSNLDRPLFAEVWSDIKKYDNIQFQELQRLEKDFDRDPFSWEISWKKRITCSFKGTA